MASRGMGFALLRLMTLLGLSLMMSAAPAQAQSTPYDDFSGKHLDPAKWIGFQVAPGAFNGSPLELTRNIRGGGANRLAPFES